jgi:hypothetical protein
MGVHVENQLSFLEYFSHKALGIDHQAEEMKIYDNTVDKGEEREKILLTFLKEHLPKRCEIMRGGYIFDHIGNRSNQIDLIVTSEFTLQFQKLGATESKSFNCTEGTIAVASVKSFLNKKELFDALDNLASLPTTRLFVPNTAHDDLFRDVVMKTPFKVIFAFKGISTKAILEDLKQYFKEKQPSEASMPDLIIVNNSCAISKIGIDGFRNQAGDFLPFGSYFANCESKHIGGYALMKLIFNIQEVSNLSSMAMIHFNRYEQSVIEAMREKKELPPVEVIDRDEILGNPKK